MNLKYKSDWEETKNRYKSWWAHDNTGRCGMWIEANLKDVKPAPLPKVSSDPEVKWRDLEYHAINIDNYHKRTFFGGEAFPSWTIGHPGHDSMAVFLGCKVKLEETTGWVEPIWTGEKLETDKLKFDENNPHYQFALKWQKFAVENSRGRSIPPVVTALGACGDALAWIRGSEQLLYDVLDMPEEVKKADLRLTELFIRYYSVFYELALEAAEGSATWFPLWAPGKFYALANDFAYMISPDSFRKIFVPSLEKQMDFLDYSVYHVDGEGCFNHLDTILELNKLQAVQILPGAGKPSPLHYLPLLKKVQAAKKNLWIGLEKNEVEEALSLLSARGLFIHVYPELDSKEEAETLLKNAEKWSRNR